MPEIEMVRSRQRVLRARTRRPALEARETRMAASPIRASHAACARAAAKCWGMAVAVGLSVAVAPAGAAGLAGRIVSAQHSRSGTVYWSFERDGSDRREVLRVSGGEVLVRSADGRRVLVLETEHHYGLHLARVDGRQRRVLQPEFDPKPAGPGPDGVALSPDGTRLAAIVRHWTYQPAFGPIVLNPPHDGYDLVTFDADGGNRQVVVPMTRETPLSDLRWAPGGRDLAFTRAPFPDCGQANGDHPDCTYTVELVAADGSAAPRVVARVAKPFGAETSYELSPDGRRIAYPAAGSQRLTVARLDGSARRTLSRERAADPDWSPDGRKIRFGAGHLVGPDFYAFDRYRIVTVAGGKIARFSNRALVTAWSPDGRWLLGSDQRRRGLLLYRPDGRSARRIPGTKRDVLGGARWEGGRRL
jgi:dipeptidyl aminopeptidase/acylaminoacyl peptidase